MKNKIKTIEGEMNQHKKENYQLRRQNNKLDILLEIKK